MEYVAGIDLSSFAIDIVKLPRYGASGPKICSYSLGKNGTAFDRARNVRMAMPARTDEWWGDVVAIGIEEPFGRGMLSTAAGYRIQGAVLSCLPPLTLVEPWPPATWKARIKIGGNANKEAIFAFVMERENKARRSMGMSQDAADAYCIALATISKLENA